VKPLPLEAAQDCGPVSVLLVDDEESLVRQMKFILDDEGVSSVGVGTGREALDLLESTSFAVAVFDVNLPDMDGISLLERWLERQPDVSVLMVTGQATLESAVKAMGLGASGFLPKPLDTELFAAEVREAIARHRLKVRNRALITELENENTRFKAVCHCMADGLITVGREGRIQTFNRRVAEIMGLSQDLAVTLHIREVLVMPEVDLTALMSACRDGKKPIRLRDRILKTKTSGDVPVDIGLAPIAGAAGEDLGWVFSIREIHDEKELQAQLAITSRMAAIGTLAAGVAHEINNPLQIIQYSSVLWDSVSADNPVAKQSYDKIQRAISRCTTIVRSLSRTAAPAAATPGPVEIRAAVTHSLNLIEHQLPWEKIRLKVSHAPNLPPVMAHGNEVQQILLNLLSNARDAMPDGGELSIRTEIRGDCVAIDVTDTGMGIPPENLDRIFDSFFTTKHPGKGMGLGLYIAYNLAKKHGGEIQVKSQVGVGTTMTLRFPVLLEGHVPERIVDEPVAPRAGLRILIADDEKDLVELLTGSFKARGHDVTSVLTGEDAVKMVQRTPSGFDLIMLDLAMPGIGGWEAMARIRVFDPGVPIVVVTGWLDAEPPEPPSSDRDGPLRILTKPVRMEAILKILSEFPPRSRS